MSIYIFRLSGSEIIGARIAVNGASIPNDSVSVIHADYLLAGDLKTQMRSDGRSDNPHFDDLQDPKVFIPSDSRSVIDVSALASEVMLSAASNVTITLPNAPNYTGTQYLDAFGEIFRFDFVAGVANRTDILFPETGIYKFKSNATLKVVTPFDVKVYR